jgi:hypothetical protein
VTTGTCATGVCANSATQICVWMPNEMGCPSTNYTKPTLIFGSIQDGRTCSTCSCATTPGTCTATATYYTDTGCTTGEIGTLSLNGPQSCSVGGVGILSARIIDTGTPTGGACAPSGGVASGQVAGAGPFVTVCCM